jgi:hypothetical protein
MKPLTEAQERILGVLREGGHVNQGNLVLVDADGRCAPFGPDDATLRELINRRLVWVNPETTHWEARPGEIEDGPMTEDYYRQQADAMCQVLTDLIEEDSHGRAGPRHVNMMNVARQLAWDYTRRQLSSDERNFRDMAWSVGADPEWYGRELVVENVLRGKTIRASYRVVGINVNRPKNTIMLVTSRGRETWADAAFVAQHLDEVLPEQPQSGRRAIQV